MAKNPKNNDACNVLAAAISECARNRQAVIKDRPALIVAYNALMREPPPCPADCLWGKMGRAQKCACCCRNRRMKDLYESG